MELVCLLCLQDPKKETSAAYVVVQGTSLCLHHYEHWYSENS